MLLRLRDSPHICGQNLHADALFAASVPVSAGVSIRTFDVSGSKSRDDVDLARLG
jgi:hypothetical protein